MINKITSRENLNIKHASKLLNSAKFRKENRQFIIEGIRLCMDAVKSGIRPQKVFYTEKCYAKFQIDIEKILSVSGQAYVISENIINLMVDTSTTQGIVCLCEFVDKKIQTDKIKECSSVVLLENIQNPANMGAIFRTCDALGVKTVAITKGCCDIYNSKVLRGGMGSVFRVNIFEIDDILDFIKFLNSNSFKTYAASIGAETISVTDLDFKNKTAIVFGNEGNGVTFSTANACKEKITIPMNENAESLNVAVAAGIIIWEMTKLKKGGTQ